MSFRVLAVRLGLYFQGSASSLLLLLEEGILHGGFVHNPPLALKLRDGQEIGPQAWRVCYGKNNHGDGCREATEIYGQEGITAANARVVPKVGVVLVHWGCISGLHHVAELSTVDNHDSAGAIHESQPAGLMEVPWRGPALYPQVRVRNCRGLQSGSSVYGDFVKLAKTQIDSTSKY